MVMRLGILRGRILAELGQPAEALDQLVTAAGLAAELGQHVKEDQALALLIPLADRLAAPAVAQAARDRRELLVETRKVPKAT